MTARVAQLVTELEPGGAERIVYELATGLPRRKFDQLVISVAPATGGMARRIEEAGVPVRSIDVRRELSPGACRRLERLLRKERVDLLHTHLVHADYLGRRAAARGGVKAVVSTVHVPASAWGFKRLLAEALTAKRADATVCVSKSARREYVARVGVDPGTVRVIYNGVDPARFDYDRSSTSARCGSTSDADSHASRLTPSLPGMPADGGAGSEATGMGLAAERGAAACPRSRTVVTRQALGLEPSDRVVVSIGRLRPEKGHDVALRAVKLLAESEERTPDARLHGRAWRLVIAGDGPERKRLERLSSRLGLAGRAVFAGQRDDVPEILAASDCLVAASRFEGFGLAVVEGMAAGLPVVASRVDALPEVVEDGVSGVLVEADDPGAFADAMRRVLSDRELAARLGRRARERVAERFTLAAMCEAHDALYTEVLRTKGAGPLRDGVPLKFPSGGLGRKPLAGQSTSAVAVVGALLSAALRWRRAPAAVLAAAFLLRAGWGLSRPREFAFPDSLRHDGLGRMLAKGPGFRLNGAYAFLPREHWGTGYVAHAEPGYPVFLAGLYAVGLRSPAAVRLVQAILGTATVWLVMLLARRMLGREAAVLAGAVAAFEPHLVFFTGLVLTETLFTLLLVSSLFFLVRAGDPDVSRTKGSETSGRRRLIAAAAWGALAGAGALVRSTFLLFMPMCAAADVAFAARGDRGRHLKIQLLAFGVFALALAPWTVRNAVRLGAFVPGTTRMGLALYMSVGPDAYGGWDEDRFDWPSEELARVTGEVKRDRFLRDAATEYALRHPVKTALVAFAKLGRLWSPVPWARGYRTAFYWTVGIVSFILLIGAAGAGAVILRREWRAWWWATAPAAYLTMLTLVFAGSVRYRVPAHAALAVLAGAAYAALVRRLGAGDGDTESHR